MDFKGLFLTKPRFCGVFFIKEQNAFLQHTKFLTTLFLKSDLFCVISMYTYYTKKNTTKVLHNNLYCCTISIGK